MDNVCCYFQEPGMVMAQKARLFTLEKIRAHVLSCSAMYGCLFCIRNKDSW